MSDKKLIGRLTRERYMHNGTLVEKTTFKVLKRRSKLALGDFIFDPELDIAAIDFSKYETGIYELTATNISHDCESGIIDDWDLTLLEVEG